MVYSFSGSGAMVTTLQQSWCSVCSMEVVKDAVVKLGEPDESIVLEPRTVSTLLPKIVLYLVLYFISRVRI